MECINIDFIGPYPDKGYVLNFIDTFTRWVELYPVPEATAEYAAKCLLQHFGRYGSPTYIQRLTLCYLCNPQILNCYQHTTQSNTTILVTTECYCRTE
jgi:hypothetical protein